MENNINPYKKQLYPKKNCWDYMSDKDDLRPAARDVGQIDCLISQLIQYNEKVNNFENKISDKKGLKDVVRESHEDYSKSVNEIDDYMKKFLRAIYSSNMREDFSEYKLKNSNFTAKDIKVDIVKGSIYKIKKYFLENNNLKDIRGGSMMIDYLNIDKVEELIIDNGFSKDNIIFCGGGNIFLVFPKGYGHKFCKLFETEFTKISLTVMSAFESMECTLWDFLFNFKKIKKQIETKVTERSKMKVYEINPDLDNYECRKITLKGKSIEKDTVIDFEKQLNKYQKVSKGICNLCNTRDAKYKITDEAEELNACSSCVRKHIVGKEKSLFYDEYVEYVRKNEQGQKEFKIDESIIIDSVNKIGDEIAVIYGDGNNMGSIVKNIENTFEMMYFSRRTDKVTKGSVYHALFEAMKDKARFEVVGLGGDDIFIIVPAKYAFKIAKDIIEKFDSDFGVESETNKEMKQITMSVGIAIGKCATPIASLAELAQMRLKKAKELVKNDELDEGSLDVIEIVGDMYIGEENRKRLFPMTKSNLDVFMKEMKIFKDSGRARSQLYKIGYSKENMDSEEFELFYYYQNSKQTGKNGIANIDKFIGNVIKKSNRRKCKKKDSVNLNRVNPYEIDWNELILLYERGVANNEQNS